MSQRVVQELNAALHALMAADPSVYFLGEDVLDPYGGAFKVSRGLSARFPERTLTTPISENGIVGVANGLALAGQKAIVELMFGDFVFLAFDQIVNFAAKSRGMYGSPQAHRLLVRCPVGGHRGYGATHSQTPTKHLVGVPDLDLYELSPLHPMGAWLPRLLASGRPAVLFEHKTLYTQPLADADRLAPIFLADTLDPEGVVARAYSEPDPAGQVLLIAGGGQFYACLEAARELLLEHEIECQVVVPLRLYPVPLAPLAAVAGRAARTYVVEESPPGGTWGAEVAHQLHAACWGSLRAPVGLIHSRDCPIPSARHLERQVLVITESIVNRVRGDCAGA